LVRKALIAGQRSQNLAIDPDLLAGNTPQWAISFFRFLMVLTVLPFCVWLVIHVMPEDAVYTIGSIVDRAIWSNLKTTDLTRCTIACRDLVFGMVALPTTWITGLVGALFWRRYLASAAAYQAHWLDRQPGMTDSKRRTIGVFRDQTGLMVTVLISTIVLQAAAPLLVGDLRFGSAQIAYTRLPFAAFCALLNLATSAMVAGLIPTPHTTKSTGDLARRWPPRKPPGL
jgi:hypothetical protein